MCWKSTDFVLRKRSGIPQLRWLLVTHRVPMYTYMVVLCCTVVEWLIGDVDVALPSADITLRCSWHFLFEGHCFCAKVICTVTFSVIYAEVMLARYVHCYLCWIYLICSVLRVILPSKVILPSVLNLYCHLYLGYTAIYAEFLLTFVWIYPAIYAETILPSVLRKYCHICWMFTGIYAEFLLLSVLRIYYHLYWVHTAICTVLLECCVFLWDCLPCPILSSSAMGLMCFSFWPFKVLILCI